MDHQPFLFGTTPAERDGRRCPSFEVVPAPGETCCKPRDHSCLFTDPSPRVTDATRGLRRGTRGSSPRPSRDRLDEISRGIGQEPRRRDPVPVLKDSASSGKIGTPRPSIWYAAQPKTLHRRPTILGMAPSMAITGTRDASSTGRWHFSLNPSWDSWTFVPRRRYLDDARPMDSTGRRGHRPSYVFERGSRPRPGRSPSPRRSRPGICREK
jgi:hypothetical protein